MRFILAAVMMGVCCIHLPAQDTAEEAAKLHAEVSRLRAENASLRKLLRDTLAGGEEMRDGSAEVTGARQRDAGLQFRFGIAGSGGLILQQRFRRTASTDAQEHQTEKKPARTGKW